MGNHCFCVTKAGWEDARETRPCRMELQTLRLVPLYPKVAKMASHLGLARRHTGWQFFC